MIFATSAVSVAFWDSAMKIKFQRCKLQKIWLAKISRTDAFENLSNSRLRYYRMGYVYRISKCKTSFWGSLMGSWHFVFCRFERSSKFPTSPPCWCSWRYSDDDHSLLSATSRLMKLEFQFFRNWWGEVDRDRGPKLKKGGGPGRINLELQQLRGGPRRRMRMMLPQA